MISHHHRCVFVHVPKTAGQSIEAAFLDDLGLDWGTREVLLLRPNPNPKVGPPRLAHLTAGQYTSMRWMPEAQYSEYYTFGFVRDPWARTLSFYRYLGYSEWCDLETFLETHLAKRLWRERYWFVRPQVEYLESADRTMHVDFVGRFESLDSDFATVARQCGLATTDLPHRNATKKPARMSRRRWKTLRRRMRFRLRHLREPHTELTPRAIQMIHDLYGKDAEAFGYDPPS